MLKTIKLTSENFELVKEAIVKNADGKIILEDGINSSVYRVLINETGQILLDPIHPKEQWLWQNSEALAMVRKGIQEAREGKGEYLGSFAQYADLEIDD
jgi:hypothetical protein